MKCRVLYRGYIDYGEIAGPQQGKDFDYVKDAIQYAHEHLIGDSYYDQDSIRIVKLQRVTTWEEGEFIGGNEWIVMKATGLSPKEQKGLL